MKNKIFIDETVPQWKGNMHMHTIRSDGKLTPQELMKEYKTRGYHFCLISDHEIYWDSDEFDEDDFLVLGGTESSIRMDRDNPWLLEYRLGISHKAMHFGCVKDPGMSKDGLSFSHDQRVPRVIDRGIDTWNYTVQFLKDHGNLVFINHPDWSRVEPELLLAITGCFAMEIWNSGNVQHCGGRDDSYIWDYCLRKGKRILVVAGDDAHNPGAALGASFTSVMAKQLTKESIVKALREGDFYASCGPQFLDLRVVDDKLKMKFSPVKRVEIIAYDGEGNSCFAGEGVLTSYEWNIPSFLKYLRVMITDEKGQNAWAQPIFLDELLDAPVFSEDPII